MTGILINVESEIMKLKFYLKPGISIPHFRTCAGMALMLALTGWQPAAQAAESSDVGEFSAAQQAQIGQIAENYLTTHPDKVGEMMATYLAEHPEFLVAGSEKLRQQQQVAQQQMAQQMALSQQMALLDKTSPSVGPTDSKVAMVMFFDYQCGYCSDIAPAVTALIKANPDVRFVFKELPIFSSRWPMSALAARVGEQIWLSKGADAYLTYHNALYSTGHVEGKLTEQDIHMAAKSYLDDKTLTNLSIEPQSGPIYDGLTANRNLAQQLHITGTPAFVIMPQAVKTEAQKVSVVPGSTTQDVLQRAIQLAQG